MTELYIPMLKMKSISFLSLFFSLCLSLSLCMHKQTQYLKTFEKKKEFFHSEKMIVTFEYLSPSLSLHNQTKEERVIFSPRGKRHHRLSQDFFPFCFSIRIELCKQTENESGSEYAPLSMTRIQSTSKACRYSFIQRMTYSIFDSNSRVSKTTKIFHQLDKRRKNPFVNDTKDVIGKMISSMS